MALMAPTTLRLVNGHWSLVTGHWSAVTNINIYNFATKDQRGRNQMMEIPLFPLLCKK